MIWQLSVRILTLNHSAYLAFCVWNLFLWKKNFCIVANEFLNQFIEKNWIFISQYNFIKKLICQLNLPRIIFLLKFLCFSLLLIPHHFHLRIMFLWKNTFLRAIFSLLNRIQNLLYFLVKIWINKTIWSKNLFDVLSYPNFIFQWSIHLFIKSISLWNLVHKLTFSMIKDLKNKIQAKFTWPFDN